MSTLPSIRQQLRYDDCLEDVLSGLFCAVFCNTVVHNHMHTDMSSFYGWTVLDLGYKVCFCALTRANLFVLGLVGLCLVYFLFVVFGCEYQCNWLPGKTHLSNELLCAE